MGLNVLTGPAFNYGYAGGTFGRSAGFFNVRPDALASPPNPSLRFMTANVQRMIITNTVKVGNGTSDPTFQLRIAGGQPWTTDNWIGSVELDNGAAIGWRSGGGANSAGIGHSGGGMYFFDSLADPPDTANPPTYRMVIKPGGNVGIGTTTPVNKLEVAGDIGASAVSVQGAVTAQSVFGISANNYGVYGHSDSSYGVFGDSASGYGLYGQSGSGYGVFGFSTSNYAGYFQGNVYVTGTLTQNSDVRLKGNLTNLRYGLRDVLRLRPVTWTWNDRPDHGRQLGLIAQEVEPVIPELVTRGTGDAHTLGLNYIGLVPVVIQAIQEQQVTIQEQRGAISRLTDENAALKARLAAIEHGLASMERPRKK
jgi:hypothetical protein